MKSSGSERWALDLDLIRRGGAEIDSPFDGRKAALSWSVTAVPSRFLPISIVECRIEGLGHVARGYGDQALYESSLAQAFAEAWERLWFLEARSGAGSVGSRRSSNGFASGRTAGEALEGARSELIERSVFLSAWDRRRGWAQASARGLMNSVREAALERLGWRIRLYRLVEAKLGEVYCGLGTREPRGGVLFDACFRRHGMSAAATQSKVLRSLLRSAAVFDSWSRGSADLPERGGPESHRTFYLDPARSAAFDFLEDPDGPGEPVALGAYERLVSRVVVKSEGFPFVALAENPAWPELRWGRESLREGGNPWPHPLA